MTGGKESPSTTRVIKASAWPGRIANPLRSWADGKVVYAVRGQFDVGFGSVRCRKVGTAPKHLAGPVVRRGRTHMSIKTHGSIPGVGISVPTSFGPSKTGTVVGTTPGSAISKWLAPRSPGDTS